ncbi:sporulation initiation factor Spo0A C-terminal domain-containing protein [Bacillus halotolerans]|uniref:sporulation initiation factor Spo0A C-terminal domain-containing protein n=1 Tax=Bacillus halotolerans TaxID=260554 RepID=UPI0020C36FC3|nr:sporulation initiation factor Spo0A C-terminal domain-containing protein [Bacillus halotolerans]UTL73306.1 response regulator [Bacillus halotolerans]
MEKNLTILLIEDDEAECQAMSNYIESTTDVKLVGITKDSMQALEYFFYYHPDVIVLDLELHYGKGDGLSFLENMTLQNIGHKPFILVTTNNNSQIIHNQARKFGADFIIPKYKENYSAENSIQFLRSLKQSIQYSNKSKSARSASHNTPETPQKHQEGMEKRLFSEFNHIGISPKMKGRKYLTYAVQILLEEPTAKVCTLIANKYSKTEASVSRAMQNAINNAWSSSNIDNLTRYYTAHIRSDKCVPTYMEFIHYYADKIKNDL